MLAAAAGAHPSEVIFTSGGTEADNLAVKGLYWARHAENPARTRILCSAVEHHAVLDTVEWLERHEGAEVSWLPVDADGVVDLAVLAAELSRDPASIALVTVMWANNEVGSIQPVAEIVELAHRAGVPVHSDAVQAFGSVPVDFRATGLDAMSISGHKIGGPVGVGALMLGRAVKLTPVQHGGGQERDVRSGTLDTASIAAFAAAAEAVTSQTSGGTGAHCRAPGPADRRRPGRGAGRRAARGPRSRTAAGQRPLHLPRLRRRLTAVPARSGRGRILHRIGLHGGCTPAVPRAAGHGTGRGHSPGRPAVQPGAFLHRRPTSMRCWPPCPAPTPAHARPAWPATSPASRPPEPSPATLPRKG